MELPGVCKSTVNVFDKKSFAQYPITVVFVTIKEIKSIVWLQNGHCYLICSFFQPPALVFSRTHLTLWLRNVSLPQWHCSWLVWR